MLRMESRFSGTMSASATRMANCDSRNATSSRMPVESIRPASSSDSLPDSAARSSRNRKLSSMNFRTFGSTSFGTTASLLSGDEMRGCGRPYSLGVTDEHAVPQLCRECADEGRVVAEADDLLGAALVDELLD